MEFASRIGAAIGGTRPISNFAATAAATSLPFTFDGKTTYSGFLFLIILTISSMYAVNESVFM